MLKHSLSQADAEAVVADSLDTDDEDASDEFGDDDETAESAAIAQSTTSASSAALAPAIQQPPQPQKKQKPALVRSRRSVFQYCDLLVASRSQVGMPAHSLSQADAAAASVPADNASDVCPSQSGGNSDEAMADELADRPNDGAPASAPASASPTAKTTAQNASQQSQPQQLTLPAKKKPKKRNSRNPSVKRHTKRHSFPKTDAKVQPGASKSALVRAAWFWVLVPSGWAFADAAFALASRRS